ncbi:hypothetical protein LCGC14_2476480 [marine sediment metagenome]|uniref:Uncharacterized protein n=1 Tax=marine sediment metagenome TaxID=412755 RepID=A0A0F9DKY1_9ZZZZ
MSKIEEVNNILEKKIINLFQTKEGKKFLKQNKKRTIKEAKTNTGWFSPEEDKAWAYLNEDI